MSSGTRPRAAVSSSPMNEYVGNASERMPLITSSHCRSVCVTRSAVDDFSSICRGSFQAALISVPASLAACRATSNSLSNLAVVAAAMDNFDALLGTAFRVNLHDDIQNMRD